MSLSKGKISLGGRRRDDQRLACLRVGSRLGPQRGKCAERPAFLETRENP
jgi:hypothetical protein